MSQSGCILQPAPWDSRPAVFQHRGDAESRSRGERAADMVGGLHHGRFTRSGNHISQDRWTSLMPLLLCGSAACPSATEPFSVTMASSDSQADTARVVPAAVNISKLASLSTSVVKSPFFTCILLLSSIVQLAVHRVSAVIRDRPPLYRAEYRRSRIHARHVGNCCDDDGTDLGCCDGG